MGINLPPAPPPATPSLAYGNAGKLKRNNPKGDIYMNELDELMGLIQDEQSSSRCEWTGTLFRMTRLPTTCINSDCGASFTPHNNHQRFCSPECREHSKTMESKPVLHGIPTSKKEAVATKRTYYLDKDNRCLQCTLPYKWASNNHCMQCEPLKESA